MMEFNANNKHKLNTFLIAILLVISQSLSCEREDDQKKALDMIITRTMGLAYLEEDKLAEAEAAFRQLIEIAPKEALGYANLGLVYIRMGKYLEAEEQLNKALEVERFDPEIRLNLAEVFILTNQNDRALQLLEETLKQSPDHIRTLYKLGQLYAKSQEISIRLKGEELWSKVVEFIPANIVVRLQLIELLLRHDKLDQAINHMEDLNKQIPELPDEAYDYYERTLALIFNSKVKEAFTQFNIFHNILKPTSIYRAGFDELKGIGGPLIGTPIITFRQELSFPSQQEQNVLATLRFTDVTEAAGLHVLANLYHEPSVNQNKKSIIALADFDGNGTQDLYVSGWHAKKNENTKYLFRNDFGKYIDITNEAGITHPGKDMAAFFIDYDNDGYLDLYIVNAAANLMYYHFAPRKFRNVAGSAGVVGDGSGYTACFADFDHDGDLDLYQANTAQNRFYRNNLDGTFSERSLQMGISGVKDLSRDLAFGDFDDDGDLDFFVVNADSGNILYTNLRQGQFGDVTANSGLQSKGGSQAVAAGDYNNDGLLDLFVTPLGSDPFCLYQNKGKNSFEKDARSEEMYAILENIICLDAHFFDFDNDGFLDLIVVAKAKDENVATRGVFLFHNNGEGIFEDVSQLLPQDLPSGEQVLVADYNEDGDLDIFLSAADGTVHLLRNDGGNANKYLTVRLVGLRTGSGKNNYFGIGAKIEVKSGDLYQSHVVSKPVSHFGLGQRPKADVVRILWTNGVPQNMFAPGSNQVLLEKQVLKGSCPFLYAWNGEGYEFVTDVLWRSALGMPLGIMGGETTYAFADPSQDYFKIPGEMLQERNGIYSIQLTSELWETAYFDQIQLITLDHPDSIDVYVNERFSVPPYPPLTIYNVVQRRFPRSVYDNLGNDLTNVTRFKDDVYISNLIPERYQGVTKLHDLILDLGDLSQQTEVILYLNGWIFPTDASINIAISQSSQTKIYLPSIQVKDAQGKWQTVIDNIGFPMGKNKYVIVDLSDKFLSHNYQVRVRTNMQIYWDYIFFTVGKHKVPVHEHTLYTVSANLHYRGFSRLYRKGGRYGPHWFDYSEVVKETLWRDLEGDYTRYGDVLELLLQPDSKYVITNAGDEITVEFDALQLPELPANWSRDFIIYTDGWLKDGDLNTALGQTSAPLPFRGMSCYPYEANVSYPTDESHQHFIEKYIKRRVTTEKFRKFILRH